MIYHYFHLSSQEFLKIRSNILYSCNVQLTQTSLSDMLYFPTLYSTNIHSHAPRRTSHQSLPASECNVSPASLWQTNGNISLSLKSTSSNLIIQTSDPITLHPLFSGQRQSFPWPVRCHGDVTAQHHCAAARASSLLSPSLSKAFKRAGSHLRLCLVRPTAARKAEPVKNVSSVSKVVMLSPFICGAFVINNSPSQNRSSVITAWRCGWKYTWRDQRETFAVDQWHWNYKKKVRFCCFMFTYKSKAFYVINDHILILDRPLN